MFVSFYQNSFHLILFYNSKQLILLITIDRFSSWWPRGNASDCGAIEDPGSIPGSD